MQFTYYVLLSRPDDHSLLLLSDGDKWTLPSFDVNKTDFRLTGHVNEEIARSMGLEISTLRITRHHEDVDDDRHYRVYTAEVLNLQAEVPEGAKWLTQDEVSKLRFTTPEQHEAVDSWLFNRKNPTELRAPWSNSGWFAEASDWILSQLERLNIKITGTIVQERTWAISCVMRVRTNVGDVYFKATPSFMRHEAAVTEEMSVRHPELVPAPLAVNAARGWMLMLDFQGQPLIGSPDINRWEYALQTYAQMQVEQSARVEGWLEIGVPDRGLNRMVELTDPLFTVSSQLLSNSSEGLSEAELDGIKSLSMKIKLLCANLGGYNVPHTLIHGDLGGNILVKGDGYVFFDWTDACISHPFFDLATIVKTAFDDSVLKNDAGVRNRLRDAFLEPWTAYETMDRLVHGYELSRSLGSLHQAMSYMWILMNLEKDARWELQSGLVMWLKSLLRILPPGK